MPRWSPDGGRLAYVAAAGGVLQVFTKSLDSSKDKAFVHFLFARVPNK